MEKIKTLSFEELDEAFIKKGLAPPSSIKDGNPLMVHVGVCDLESFEQYLRMMHDKFLRQRTTLEHKELKGDEMYEWVLSFHAAYSDILANFLAAKKTSGDFTINFPK